MTMLRALLTAAAFCGLLSSAPALADGLRERDQRDSNSPAPTRDVDRVRQNTRDGRWMPLPQLERQIMPMMGGADYLGPELNGDTYRFKFMRNGRVIWLDVDGQGRVLRRSRDH